MHLDVEVTTNCGTDCRNTITVRSGLFENLLFKLCFQWSAFCPFSPSSITYCVREVHRFGYSRSNLLTVHYVYLNVKLHDAFMEVGLFCVVKYLVACTRFKHCQGSGSKSPFVINPINKNFIHYVTNVFYEYLSKRSIFKNVYVSHCHNSM